MLDEDLAEFYGAGTGRFNEQVRRNLPRFSEDFMFRMTNQGLVPWRSQIVMSNPGASLAHPSLTGYGVLIAINDHQRAGEVPR